MAPRQPRTRLPLAISPCASQRPGDGRHNCNPVSHRKRLLSLFNYEQLSARSEANMKRHTKCGIQVPSEGGENKNFVINGELWVVIEMNKTICNPINESNLKEE